MKVGAIWWLLLGTLAAVRGAGSAEPAATLPQWSEADRKALKAAQLVPGLALLEKEAAEPGETPPTEADPPTAAEITGERPKPQEIPERFLEAYFGARPQAFLVDPQGLLPPRVQKDRENFLRYHSEDSRIDFYVYVLGAEQEIPGEVRTEELMERLFDGGKPCVLVFYPLGAPQRSTVRVSLALGAAISPADQRRALDSPIAQALEKGDPLDQFEVFCVQMSIRLYWMERAAGLVKDDPTAGELAGLPEKKKAAPMATHGETRAKIMALVSPWLLPAGAGAGGLLLIGGGIWLLRSRARYRFPEFEIAPRLGGAHGAGIGAVISFGSTTQSPTTQRRDTPDYLAGL